MTSVKTVFIAEKPLMAQAIAEALCPSYTKKDGYFLGSNNFIITYAYGHLIELSNFEDYSEHLRTWRYEDLPFIPENFKLSPIKEKQTQLEKIRKITKVENGEQLLLINATDSGLEGQLIYHYIASYLGLLKKPSRLHNRT